MFPAIGYEAATVSAQAAISARRLSMRSLLRVRPLDGVAHGVGEAQLHHRVVGVGALARPAPERGAEAVHGGAPGEAGLDAAGIEAEDSPSRAPAAHG